MPFAAANPTSQPNTTAAAARERDRAPRRYR